MSVFEEEEHDMPIPEAVISFGLDWCGCGVVGAAVGRLVADVPLNPIVKFAGALAVGLASSAIFRKTVDPQVYEIGQLVRELKAGWAE